MSSLIEGYNYDIFISYRQKDNKYDGWVTEFVNQFKGELEATFKEDVSIYFDENPRDGLLESHNVDKSLQEKLKCLIFIPIISRTYCDPKSYAWQYEFCEFNKLAKEYKYGRDIRLASGNVASRILPVKIHDLDPEDKELIEKELGEVLRGIEFIYKEPGVNRPLKPNDDARENLNKTNYRNQINKVANAVKDIIGALKLHGQQQKEVLTENRESLSAAREALPSSGKNKKYPVMAVSATVLILAIIGLIFIPKLFKSTGQVEKSIAVLPFRNLSNDTTQIYFCDGFMEEILNNLQKIQSFTVRSRTSSDQYRDTKKSITTIGQELNVNYLVEGSVQREGNNLKIWVQLIDTKADKHLWSNDYMREITIEQIFSLQSEIARSIAVELKAVLTPEEIESLEKRPTENIEAYNLFLQGNYYYWKSYDSQDFEKSIALYEKVIEIDPGFALAYTRLAQSYLSQFWFYHTRTNEVLNKSRQLIDMVFEIDPHLPQAHLASGVYYYMSFNDYPKALEQLELALKEQPANSEAIYYMACVYRRAGNWEMAKSLFEKASDLDPKNTRILFNTGETFDLMRLFPEALRYYENAISINPDWTYPYRDIIELFLKMDGNTIRARKFPENAAMRQKACQTDSLTLEVVINTDICDGKFEDALKLLSESKFIVFEAQWFYRPRHLYYALVYELMNQPDLERAYYDSTRVLIEEKIAEVPDDPRLYSTLGIAYAGLGMKEKAVAAGEEAVKMLPVEKESWKGVYLVGDLAYTYVKLGMYPEALNKLDYLLSIPGPLSTNILKLDPRWAPLRDLPEFDKIIKKYTIN